MQYTIENIEIIKKHCLVVLDYIFNHNPEIYNQIGYIFPDLIIKQDKDLKNYIWANRKEIIEYILNENNPELMELINDAITTYDYIKNHSSIFINKNI